MAKHDDLAGPMGCPNGPLGLQGEPGRDAPAPEPKPKRGRPRAAEEPLGPVTVHVEPAAHDRIIRLASQRKQTVSEYLRDVLAQLFRGRA